MRGLFFLLFLFVIGDVCVAQSDVDALILAKEKEHLNEGKATVFLKREDWKSLDPLVLSALLVLQGYKTFVSGDLGSSCRFNPSCSAFSAAIIRQKGFIPGILLTADRLIRCNPQAEYDHSQHLINQQTGKIEDEVADY